MEQKPKPPKFPFLLIGMIGILPPVSYLYGIGHGYQIRLQEEEKEAALPKEAKSIASFSDCKGSTLSGIVTKEYEGVGHSFIGKEEFAFRAYEFSDEENNPLCYGIVYDGNDDLFSLRDQVTISLGEVQRMIPPQEKYVEGQLIKNVKSFEIIQYKIELSPEELIEGKNTLF